MTTVTGHPIRLSPSGPVIGNTAGGPFAPGPGSRLRLVQDQVLFTAGATVDIPTTPAEIGSTIGGTDFRLVLAAPNPVLQYRAAIEVDVQNPATTVGVVSLYLDTSTDGTTWTEACSNSHNVSGGSSAIGGRMCRLELILNDGADLGVTTSPPSANLYVRARISAPTTSSLNLVLYSDGPDGSKVGSNTLELEETL